jgi:hypothetical protein
MSIGPIAVVGVMALGYGFARYKMLSAKMLQQERIDAVNVLMDNFEAIEDARIKKCITDHQLTFSDFSTWLQNEADDDRATARFRRIRALLRS